MRTAPPHLVARETAISIVINVALSLAFFLAVFHGRDNVAVWGMSNLAFDNGIQAFMITLMSTLVPGMLLLKRWGMHGGKALVARALAHSVIAACAFAGIAAAGLALGGVSAMPWTVALVFKLALGALAAAIATPLGLRAILRTASEYARPHD